MKEELHEEVIGRGWKKVMIVATVSRAAGRDFVSGIFAFLSGRKNWRIDLVQDGMTLTAESIAESIRDGLSGFIVSRPCTREVYDAIADSNLPCVHVFERDVGRRTRNMRFIENDGSAAGRKAAEHLLSTGGYASFAFYGGGERGGWVRLRREGYATVLAEKGIEVEVFPEDGSVSLANWLRGLPRPAALFAENDEAAAVAAEAARAAGLSIPRHLALIGVDDVFHEVSGVGLTSVRLGHDAVGRVAARTLDALMEGHHVPEKPIVILPMGVVARASTNQRKTPAKLVARAREFIRENLASGFGVDDVAEHLRVSRSTLDHRFREVTGQSVREAIEAARLAKARKSLASTGKTIAEVARECGFSSATRLSHVFKQRYGHAPGAMRELKVESGELKVGSGNEVH